MCGYALENEPIEGKFQMTHGRERTWQGQNWQFTSVLIMHLPRKQKEL